jgi:hypothetical protein
MKKNYRIKNLKDTEKDLISFYIEISNDDFSIYRYRSCNENSIAAFYSDKLTYTSPKHFNDPYDVSLRYDFRKVVENIYDYVKKDDYSLALEKYDFLYDEEKSLKHQIEEIVSFYFDELQKSLKSTTFIACFSEKYDNDLMWAHYSKNGTGFVVEYEYTELVEKRNEIVQKYEESILDFYDKNFELFDMNKEDTKKMIEENSSLYGIVPVIYEDGKFNATYMLEDIIRKGLYLDNFDSTGAIDQIPFNFSKETFKEIMTSTLKKSFDQSLVMNTTALYMKKRDWKYEQEWRMVLPNTDGTVFNSFKYDFGWISPVKPKSLILGEFISEDYEKMLVKFANDKNLPIYKVKSDFTKNPPKLKKGKKYTKKYIEKIINS